jgi:hypothetical protein
VKEKQRTGEIRVDAQLAAAQPATATGFFMPSSPPPQVQPPTADVRIPVRGSQPAPPAGMTPMSPSIPAGLSTPTAAPPGPWLTTRRAMMILAAALTLVGATFLTLALTRTRSAKPIAPVASRPSTPRPTSAATPSPASPAPARDTTAAPSSAAPSSAGASSAAPSSAEGDSARALAARDGTRVAPPPADATSDAERARRREVEVAEQRIAAEERRIAERREREAAERRAPERKAEAPRAAEPKPAPPRAAEPKPAPPRAAEPKPAPPRAAEAKPRERKPAPGLKIPPNMGALKLECSAPATVKIQGEGDHTGITKKTFLLVPKAYRVTIERADGSTASTFTRVVAGTTVTIACDH